MAGVENQSYDRLLARHLEAHQRLFRRVGMTLPASEASLRPTDQRLRNYDPRRDPQLMALMFQYGRICCLAAAARAASPRTSRASGTKT